MVTQLLCVSLPRLQCTWPMRMLWLPTPLFVWNVMLTSRRKTLLVRADARAFTRVHVLVDWGGALALTMWNVMPCNAHRLQPDLVGWATSELVDTSSFVSITYRPHNATSAISLLRRPHGCAS